MRILVCIKRVPAPGARISLADDGRSIDTRHLSFTTSPHEECAVEEAIRLKEKHGGSTTVLTLGPSEAEEQLRYAVSLGIDQAILVEDSHSERDPQGTAGAIAEAVKKLEEGDGGFDLLLFGNESADSGGYQVGIRVARSLARPILSGIKSIDIDQGRLTARRQTAQGFEVYRMDLPAVLAVKEGINLPRYPTMPGRLRSRKAEIHHIEVSADQGGLQMLTLMSLPEQVKETIILGSGAEAAPKVVSVIRELGLL